MATRDEEDRRRHAPRHRRKERGGVERAHHVREQTVHGPKVTEIRWEGIQSHSKRGRNARDCVYSVREVRAT